MNPQRNSFSWIRLAPIMLGLFLGGANAGTVALSGSAGVFSVRVTSYKDKPFERVIKQQYDYSCGAAAVATLLTYHYGQPVDEQIVLDAMLAAGDSEKIRREGFSLLDMKNYLESNGYSANGYRISLEKLSQAGLPAIALTDTAGYLHFVVVKGMDRNRVLIGDPATGITLIPREQFTKSWKSGILFIVQSANPRQRLQNFNTQEEWNAIPRAPLSMAVSHQGLASLTLLLPGTNDF
ncbi:MAG: C39 family peptidase [Gammaproteobacteria bacterium]